MHYLGFAFEYKMHTNRINTLHISIRTRRSTRGKEDNGRQRQFIGNTISQSEAKCKVKMIHKITTYIDINCRRQWAILEIISRWYIAKLSKINFTKSISQKIWIKNHAHKRILIASTSHTIMQSNDYNNSKKMVSQIRYRDMYLRKTAARIP